MQASGKWHDDLDILSDVAKAVLSHGVAVLEASMATWDADEDDWEMWRVHMSAASARHPVSAALASVHNGACNAMLQFSNLTKAAETLCKVTVEDVHARCACCISCCIVPDIVFCIWCVSVLCMSRTQHKDAGRHIIRICLVQDSKGIPGASK